MADAMPAGPAPKLLMVSAFDAPCIAEDEAILSAAFDVRRSTGSGPAALLRALAGVLRADIVYCWFLSVYGAAALLLARSTGRRGVVVLGGVDVARDPGAGYGLWLSPWRASLARRALRSADLVLVVSEPLRDDAVRLAGYDGRNIRYLPTGYDASVWAPGGPPAGREARVLCVASVADPARLAIKGIDVLVEAARLAPEIPVSVIGVDDRFVPGLTAPPNVTFLPLVRREDLPGRYRSARVYCQPSRREGLPGALCEAMLCGCIPVAADAGGMPHAVGESGFIVPKADPAALAAAFRRAMAAPPSMGAAARARIIGLFPAEARKSGLLRLLHEAGISTGAGGDPYS